MENGQLEDTLAQRLEWGWQEEEDTSDFAGRRTLLWPKSAPAPAATAAASSHLLFIRRDVPRD